MFQKSLLFILTCSFPVLADVQNSILPLMDQLTIKDLSGKINSEQSQELAEVSCQRGESLRVISFNMLFNLPWAEENLQYENRWKNRKYRLFEYLQRAEADIIGSQELQKDQLKEVIQALKGQYGYFGVGTDDGKECGDIPAIFYRKDRVELLEGRTYYFSTTPTLVSPGPFGSSNTFTVCIFRDLLTNMTFQVVNTHLAFGNIERRYYEAKLLKEYLEQECGKMPLIVTGDFNTFPFRQELSLPFYDGDTVVSVIEEGGVKDSEGLALFGHFGPISSTNFSEKTQKAFNSLGTPGVILDHIFVNDQVTILSHGIDPAKVNGFWPSDHFPVIIECLLEQ